MVLAMHLATLGLAVAPSPALPPTATAPPAAITAPALSRIALATALAVTDMAPVAGQNAPATAPPDASPAAPPPAAPPHVPRGLDPLEPINRISYAISQPVDRFILRPAALVFSRIVPHPLRDGLRNVIANLRAPIILINDVLQLRPKRALHTLLRFILNTAIGAGGLADVAKRHPFNMPAHPNGFGNTLGYYGIGPGIYLYLPILGPSTLRDGAGGVVDLLMEPHLATRLIRPAGRRRPSLTQNSIFFGQIGLDLNTAIAAVDGIGRRADNDAALQVIKHQSVDPYATLRSSFLQDRAGEIAALRAHDGHPPAPIELDDPLRDPEAPPMAR